MASKRILTNEGVDWSILQKITFRFFFIFLGLNTWFGYNIVNDIFYPRYNKWVEWTSIFSRPLYWLDRHFYHIGTNISQYNKVVINDKPAGWVLLITIAWVSVIACLAWSILDRKSTNYARPDYWFRTYLAYYLFLSLGFYCIYKIIPVQMPFPNGFALLALLGNRSRVDLLFNFMGISPGYTMFAGICEFLAALLILIRRTRVFGCMVMTGILLNIVALNIFYNVHVKILSIQLLLISNYMLIPYISKLAQFFYKLEPVSLAEKQYKFTTPWKNYAIKALLLIPAWVTIYLLVRGVDLYKIDINRQQQKLYDVTSFIKNGDTIPPLLTDPFRIKRILFTAYYAHKYAVVYSMNDSAAIYECSWDNNKTIISFTNSKDVTPKGIFNIKTLPDKQLSLSGKWRGQEVSVHLKENPVDSLPLVKEKTIWVQRN